MQEDFVSRRISQLRQTRNVSARDMSLSIGQNANYINHIENRKMLPSMQSFFYICDYFGITPQEFFDERNHEPEQLRELTEDLKLLNPSALFCVTGIVQEMVGKSASVVPVNLLKQRLYHEQIQQTTG